MQEAQSRQSRISIHKKQFKSQSKTLYLGKFTNTWRQKPWEADSKKTVMDRFDKWKGEQAPWYFTDIKDGVQAFTNFKDVDLSDHKVITEEYNMKIKENKIRPEPSQSTLTATMIPIGVGLITLLYTYHESIILMPLHTIILLTGCLLVILWTRINKNSKRSLQYENQQTAFNAGIEP